LVLLQLGLDVETSAVCIALLLFRQTNIYLAFVVNLNFIFSIGQRFQADVIKYPTCSNTCSLILPVGCTSCLFYLIQFIPPGGVSFAAHFVAHLPVSFGATGGKF
jgi:hypothetical protein